MKQVTGWLRFSLGIFLILFGTVGHLLPLLPGSIFIMAGLLLVGEVIPAIHRQLERMEIRYPRLRAALSQVRLADGRLDLAKIAALLVTISLGYIVIGYLIYRIFPRSWDIPFFSR